MRHPWIPFLALAFLVVPGRGDERAPATGVESAPLKLGSVVPEALELADFDGKKVSFKDLRGKVVIVHFWSTLCPSEKHADPVFQRLEKHYAGSKDVVMIGIASNQNELGSRPPEGADLAKHYAEFREKIKALGYSHRIFPDHGNVLSDLFQAKTTPHCFVLDRKGTLVYSGALDDDPRGGKGEGATIYVKDAAEALVSGKEVAVRETKPYG
ncbi:MAG TPA: redoxin domain-containing protein [Planctomycetota bacterium]|nr:redoxin domain-containing protein [Planctomycetota bacterium]